MACWLAPFPPCPCIYFCSSDPITGRNLCSRFTSVDCGSREDMATYCGGGHGCAHLGEALWSLSRETGMFEHLNVDMLVYRGQLACIIGSHTNFPLQYWHSAILEELLPPSCTTCNNLVPQPLCKFGNNCINGTVPNSIGVQSLPEKLFLLACILCMNWGKGSVAFTNSCKNISCSTFLDWLLCCMEGSNKRATFVFWEIWKNGLSCTIKNSCVL